MNNHEVSTLYDAIKLETIPRSLTPEHPDVSGTEITAYIVFTKTLFMTDKGINLGKEYCENQVKILKDRLIDYIEKSVTEHREVTRVT